LRWALAGRLLLFGGSGFVAGCNGGPSQDVQVEDGSGGSHNHLDDPGSGGGAPEDDECEREVSLEPVILGEPQPFDLVIVADHSESLAWSQDALATGLQDLLTHVQGRSVRVFLLTPTQFGESSAAARMPINGEAIVSWQDPATGDGYFPAATSYSQACKDGEGVSIPCPDPEGQVVHTLEGTWEFVMPEPIAVLEPSQSSAEFAAQQEAVAAAILGLTGSGSPLEQPLCTLGRYVSQEATALPDNVVFLLITDEDDTTTPPDCLVRFESELRAYELLSAIQPCSEDCDAYQFSITGPRISTRLDFTCGSFTDTGELIPETETPPRTYHLSQACDAALAPCSEEEKVDYQFLCDTGERLASCERSCVEQDSVCAVEVEAGVDPCTASFGQDNQTWGNLAEYCANVLEDASGACMAQGGVTFEYLTTVAGTSSKESLTTGWTTENLGNYFRNMADSQFGRAHYLVEGILLDPAFSCELGPGQSYAANLAAMIDDPTHLFPLCESYAPALAGVLEFAQDLVQTEFVLDLEDDEDVSAVTVVDGSGVGRMLSADQYQFDVATQILRIEPGVIASTDTDVDVEVTSACRPIVK
jgi:hypothetical protein